MMDSMQSSRKYIGAYFFGWVWTALLVFPHSIAVNFAFPTTIPKNCALLHHQTSLAVTQLYKNPSRTDSIFKLAVHPSAGWCNKLVLSFS